MRQLQYELSMTNQYKISPIKLEESKYTSDNHLNRLQGMFQLHSKICFHVDCCQVGLL